MNAPLIDRFKVVELPAHDRKGERAWCVALSADGSHMLAGPFQTPEEAERARVRVADQQQQALDKVLQEKAQRRQAEEDRERFSENHEEAQRLAQVRSRLAERFHTLSLDDFTARTPAQKRALKVARNFASNFAWHRGAGLIFLGPAGTGKTRLACAIIETLARSDRCRRWLFYATLLDVVRAERNFQDLVCSELLVLDQLSLAPPNADETVRYLAELMGATSQPELTKVLSARIEAGRPTILVADCDLEGLRRYLGELAEGRMGCLAGNPCSRHCSIQQPGAPGAARGDPRTSAAVR